jgi:hypothetical protein
MAHPFATSYDLSDPQSLRSDIPIAPKRFAMRTKFYPFVTAGTDPETGFPRFTTLPERGWFAEISAPEAANINSFAARLLLPEGAQSVGLLNTIGAITLSVIDPCFNYDGFFLYAFIDDILPATRGTPMYRKTEIHSGFYSTLTFTEGKIYAVLLGGPEAPALTWYQNDPTPLSAMLLADVAITADTI